MVKEIIPQLTNHNESHVKIAEGNPKAILAMNKINKLLNFGTVEQVFKIEFDNNEIHNLKFCSNGNIWQTNNNTFLVKTNFAKDTFYHIVIECGDEFILGFAGDSSQIVNTPAYRRRPWLERISKSDVKEIFNQIN